MLHPIRRILLALVLALGLVAPAAAISSAVADDLKTATVSVSVSGGDHVGSSFYVVVSVRSPEGGLVPESDVALTGVGDGTPVHSQYGHLEIAGVAPSNDPVTVTATFLGAPGYAPGGTGSATTKPLLHPTFSAEPTVAKIGPGLKLTLTLSTHATNFLGQPMAGVPVAFSVVAAYQQGAPGPQTQPDRAILVCKAFTDANGFASCGGAGLLGSVVSILSGGGYATWSSNPWGNYTKLPVVTRG
jgi:hypothetical protein